MRSFELLRHEDATGVSGRGLVAEGVEFSDGTCAMRWLTAHRSSTFYESAATLVAIHGHAGKTEVVWTTDAFKRGRTDAVQDACENAPFASSGGMDKRTAMVAPSYISTGDEKEWLRGYKAGCDLAHGPGWETGSFGWGPAITINEPEDT